MIFAGNGNEAERVIGITNGTKDPATGVITVEVYALQDVANFKLVLENAEAPVAWSLKGDVPGFITIVEGTGTLIVDAAGTNFEASNMERVVTVAAKEGERDPVEAHVRCVVKPDQNWALGLDPAVGYGGNYYSPEDTENGKWLMQLADPGSREKEMG